MFGLLLWYEEPLLPWDCITLEFLAQVILRMAMERQPSEHLRVDHQPNAQVPMQNQVNQNFWGLVAGVGIFKKISQEDVTIQPG